MSGGRWCYNQDTLAYEMFPHSEVTYGLGKKNYKESVKNARKTNPLDDKLLSELAYDLLCVIHSADWYMSGDTSEETYRADVAFFKDKWLMIGTAGMIKREIEKSMEETKEELFKSLQEQEVTNEQN